MERTDARDDLIIFQYNLLLGTRSAPLLSDADLAGSDSDSPIIGARVSALKVMQKQK